MDQSPPKHVAIIGAGLSGLSLAIALHAHSIHCAIYEFRPSLYDIGDGVLLSPNALRVLDSLGVYERIRSKGCDVQESYFKNENLENTGVYYMGHRKLYGYAALRIYRRTLIKELRAMVEERGVPIHFRRKFTRVVSESAEDGVRFEFADGAIEKASLLVGADGIHSKVRLYITPNANPTYSGVMGITGNVQKHLLRFPATYDSTSPASILAKAGAFVLVPQGISGEDFLVITQRSFPERDRAGWDDLSNSKGYLREMLREHQSWWPDIVQSALENVDPESVKIWPFYSIPKLEKWTSPSSRVLILGDAAHAIPPSGAQGVNQAFEDIYTLALLLSKLSNQVRLSEALTFWQTFRQERVDRILTLTDQINTLRLPAAERAEALKNTSWDADRNISGEDGQLRWLYEPVLDDAVSCWVSKQGSTSPQLAT